ncbi:MAG TPA: hypothetical protein VI322_03590 [Candidatus Saccharimonadia bacterium]
MQAFYAGAISVEMLKDEQNRIDKEVRDCELLLEKTKAKFSELEKPLEQALWWARHCNEAYIVALKPLRRRINQALFFM